MAKSTQPVESFSLMDGATDAFQALHTGDAKAIAEKFMKKVEKELAADPIHVLHQAALIGAGLNSVTPQRLGQGLSYLAKLLAWKALSGSQSPMGQAGVPTAQKQIPDSEQEARHAS